ncbi:MAG: EAL domain-containing protein [Clostridia bacterium]|nr:EAL domain-containing protein [Clostridia bacterium]
MEEKDSLPVPETEEQTEQVLEQSLPEEQTEQVTKEDETDAKLVKMTLDSGVAPLEIRYSQINACYRKLPVAYRAYTYINSVVEGVISPEKYSYAADETETGIRLAKYNLQAAMRAVEQFIVAGRNIEFISVRVSPRMVLDIDFYNTVKSVMDKNGFKFPEKICLEFPRTVLYEDLEKVRMAILSMKLLKVKTMMAGCGEKDSPVTPLIDLPFDYLLLSPHLTALTSSRDKGTTVLEFIAFLRGLPAAIVADGVYNDDQITALSRADCFGYIPSSGYKGSVAHGRLRMPLSEAIAQKEEEEF